MEIKQKRSAIVHNNLRIGTREGVLATPWVYLSIPGGFIMAALLTQYYGIGPAVFGLIVSLPAWANALQLLYLPFVTVFLKPRDMALGPSWLNLGLWLMLAFTLPLLPTDDPAAAARFFVIFFIMASLCGSMIGLGWTGWVQTWVPSKVRGKYFGKRNLYIQITTVCFLILAMLLLKGADTPIWPFQLLIFIAVGMRFFSILWQHMIVAPEPKKLLPPAKGWGNDLLKVWRHRPFRLYLAMTAWTAFWMNSMGPFSVVFAFDFLEVSKAQFAGLSILATLSGAFMMPFWGRLVDRKGCVRVLIISITLWWSTGYVWALLTPSTAWVLYITWLLGGAVAGGFFIASFNLLFKVLPEGASTAGISLNMALSSLAAAISPILVGLVLSKAVVGSDLQEQMYRGLFILATTMILLTGFLARRIPERTGSDKEFTVTGAMRSLRTSMVSLGMAFVTNTNFTPRGKHKPPTDDTPKAPD